jgi:hypothetical protein
LKTNLNCPVYYTKRSWDSSVTIVTRLLAGRHRVQTLLRARYFLQNFLDQLWGPPSFIFSGHHGGSFSGVKQLGREVDYSSEVRNGWSYASIPPLCLYGKDKNNFTLFIYYTDPGERSPIDSPLCRTQKLQSGPKKCIHSLVINIFGINLNEISISG